MSKIKIIALGIIAFLLLVILGLVWNIGRNQKPSQQIVDKLTSTFTNSQAIFQASSAPDFGDAKIANFNNSSSNSQIANPNSSNISQNQTFSLNNSPNNSLKNSQNLEVPSFRNSQSNSENSQNQSSVPNILGDSATWDRYIFSQNLDGNFILKIPNEESPNTTSLVNSEPIFAGVFDPDTMPQENFYISDKTNHQLIGKGLKFVAPFEVENKKYWLTSFGDLFGNYRFFLSEAKFGNKQEIKILRGEIIAKIDKVAGENGVFGIRTQDGNGRNPATKNWQLDLKKVIANPNAEVILEEK